MKNGNPEMPYTDGAWQKPCAIEIAIDHPTLFESDVLPIHSPCSPETNILQIISQAISLFISTLNRASRRIEDVDAASRPTRGR